MRAAILGMTQKQGKPRSRTVRCDPFIPNLTSSGETENFTLSLDLCKFCRLPIFPNRRTVTNGLHVAALELSTGFRAGRLTSCSESVETGQRPSLNMVLVHRILPRARMASL